MADQVAAKKILQELSKREDLGNKICNDCSNLNPQWASLRYTSRPDHNPPLDVYHKLCHFPMSPMRWHASRLWRAHQVSGKYSTNFLLHIPLENSFVRSISMDTWQDDQIARMQVTSAEPTSSSYALTDFPLARRQRSI